MIIGVLQVLDCLERNVRSKPADLAELHKEDIDEVEERHERVVAASLRAMGTLLDVLLPADVSEAPGMGMKHKYATCTCTMSCGSWICACMALLGASMGRGRLRLTSCTLDACTLQMRPHRRLWEQR